MKIYAKTDVGRKREMNQDYVYVTDKPVGPFPNLLVVADGMGGHKAGDFASKYTVKVVHEELEKTELDKPEEILKSIVSVANHKLIQAAQSDVKLEGMGTTLVIATVIGNTLYFSNVGDSRLYLIGDKIKQLSKDHSLVEEMVRLGGIKAEEAKNHPDKNIIPAGILYYNIDNPIIEVQSVHEEEDADYREAVDEMILENLRMKGVVNEDTEIIRKMDDRGGKSAVIPVAFKSNGELDMRSHIYSTQKFEQLTDYVTEKSADMAAGIFGGNVDVNPYHTQKEDACTYCPYHAVCGFSPDIPGGQSRSLKTFSDEEIWEKIREGVDENGKPLDRKTVQGNPDKRL